jgi:hypothetical protein
MKFAIKSRWTSLVKVEAEIDCAEDTPKSVKSGLAVKCAINSGANPSGTVLSGAVLSYANLSGTVLSGTVLSGANPSGTVLSGAVLSYANLPVIKNIHQEIYAAASQPSALDMGNWHVCDTTHCRGGWAVFLAGSAGRDLEEKMGTAAAAALIYMASDPHLDQVPNFYSTNADALADMARLAKAEKARA